MVKMPLLGESSDELQRLKRANQLAQRVLLPKSDCGQLPKMSTKREYHSSKEEYGNPSQGNVDGMDTFCDIWGASKFLNQTECSVNYVKEHLRNSEQAIQKSNALLRVSMPCTYEIVEDADSLKNSEKVIKKLEQGTEHERLQPVLVNSNIVTAEGEATEMPEEAKFSQSEMYQSCDAVDIVLPEESASQSVHSKFHPCDHVQTMPTHSFEPMKDTVMFQDENTDMETSPHYVCEINTKNEIIDFDQEDRLLDVILKENDDDDFSLDLLPSSEQSKECEFGMTGFQAKDFLRHDKDQNPETLLKFQFDDDKFTSVPRKKMDRSIFSTKPFSPAEMGIFETSKNELSPSDTTGIQIFSQKSIRDTEEMNFLTENGPLMKEDSFTDATETCLEDELSNKSFYNKKQGTYVADDKILSSDGAAVIPPLNLSSLRTSKCHEQKKALQKPLLHVTISPENFHQNPDQEHPSFTDKLSIPICRSSHTTVWSMLPNEMILHIFSFLSQKDLKQVALVCHQFHALARDHCLWSKVEATDTELTSAWLEDFTRVQQLKLCRCKSKQLNNKALRTFFQNSRDTLRSVHVSQCGHKYLYGDNILLHVATHCRRVESVNLPWSNTSDNGIGALITSNLTLKDLDVSGNCFVSDSSFIALMEKTGFSLKTLRLNGCFALTDESFVAIANNCPDVYALDVGLCPKIESGSMILISSMLQNLKELNLRGLKCVDDNCICSISKNCKYLTKLVLANCQSITDNGVSNIAFDLPDLEDLDLSGCSKITDDGCCSMASGFKNISHLNLSSTTISQVSILAFTENFYDSLQCLKLSFCNNITQDCLKKLISFAFKLQSLHVHGCKRINIKELKENYASLEICN